MVAIGTDVDTGRWTSTKWQDLAREDRLKMNEELAQKLRALLASAMHEAPEYRDIAVLDDEPGEEPSIGFETDAGQFFVELNVLEA